MKISDQVQYLLWSVTGSWLHEEFCHLDGAVPTPLPHVTSPQTHRQKKRDDRNIMQFNKCKCKVMNLVQNIPVCWLSEHTTGVSSVSLQQWKGTVCWHQHMCSWQVKGTDYSPRFGTCETTPAALAFSLRFSSTRKTLRNWNSFSGRILRWTGAGAHDAQGKAEATPLVESHKEKAKRKDLKVFLYLIVGYREHKTRVFWARYWWDKRQ